MGSATARRIIKDASGKVIQGPAFVGSAVISGSGSIGPQMTAAHEIMSLGAMEVPGVTRFDFGEALRVLKAGRRVARAGWNGKGMWIVLLRPGRGLPHCALTHEGGAPYDVSPCFAMKTAGGDLQPGWLASQADMLAEDWQVVS